MSAAFMWLDFGDDDLPTARASAPQPSVNGPPLIEHPAKGSQSSATHTRGSTLGREQEWRR